MYFVVFRAKRFLTAYSIQVIQNACATQALINLLLNVKHEDVKLGETLAKFQQFTQAFEPAVNARRMERI